MLAVKAPGDVRRRGSRGDPRPGLRAPVRPGRADLRTGPAAARRTDGPRLADLADVVIDNGAPEGDAAIELTPGVRIGAVSSLTGVLAAQILTELTCRRLLELGQQPPVYVSANLAAGDAHNRMILERYRQRVRPIEP